MFNKIYFNQLTNNIEKEDYIRQTIITPATVQIKKQISAMTSKERQEAMKTYDVHYTSALEARMIARIVSIRFKLYGINW